MTTHSSSQHFVNYWLGLACASVVSLSAVLGITSVQHVQKVKHAEERKTSNRSEKYAVLVAGYNELRFTYALNRIAAFLESTGFPKNNISILDMVQEKQGTRTHLKKKLEELEKVIDDNDLFVLHFTTHGERMLVDKQPMSTLVLSFGIEELTERELQHYLARIKPGLGIVSTDSCYGGGIAKSTGKRSYIGISGTQEDQVGLASVGDTFGLYFYCAFANPDVADKNNDGKTSIYEAFQYARKMHFPTNTGYFIPLLVSEQDTTKITLTE